MFAITTVAFLRFSPPGRFLTIVWNETFWKAQGITHYRYTFRNVSFANADNIYDARIEVRDGRAVSVVRLDTQTVVDPRVFANYDTMPKVFTQIKKFAAGNPVVYWVRYQWGTGVPEEIKVEFSFRSTDDTYRITIKDFEALP